MADAAGGEDEEALVRRVRAGDEAAARALFDRLRPRLRAYVRRKLPDTLRAKVSESDVIQDAFLAAYLHLSDFQDRGDGSFARWLASILDRKLLDEKRRYLGTGKRDAARERSLRATRDGGRHSGRIASPSAVAMDAEERARVEDAIGRLAPTHRAVLRLLHERGLTLDEAADELGKSAEAVRKLHARAVVALGRRLSEG